MLMCQCHVAVIKCCVHASALCARTAARMRLRRCGRIRRCQQVQGVRIIRALGRVCAGAGPSFGVVRIKINAVKTLSLRQCGGRYDQPAC